jgi:ABC-type transport system involved in multi-copper enzyme maturation permease subunit
LQPKAVPVIEAEQMDWRETFSSPVLMREMVLSTTRKRFLAIRAAYMVVLFGIVVVMYGVYTYALTTSSYQSQSDFGVALFRILVLTQFIMIMLMAPAFAGNAISKEKEQRTFELLFTTDIRNWELILSKAMGKYLILQVLILASLPLLFLIVTFGGIRLEEIIAVFVLTSVTAFLAVSIGIFTSTVLSKSYSSIIFSYVFFIVYLFVLWLMIEHYVSAGLAKYYHPLAALWGLLFHRVGEPTPPWGLVSLINLVLALMLLLFSILIIKKMVFWDFAKWRRNLRNLGRYSFPFSKKARLYERGNIVYWKEAKSYSWRGWLVIYASLIAGTILYLFSGQKLFRVAADGLEIYIGIIFWMLFLDMVIIASTSFVSEKQKGSLPLLILTPLTGREIIIGKFLGVFRRFVPIFILSLLAILFLAFTDSSSGPFSLESILEKSTAAVFLILEIVCYSFFVILLGLFWSMNAEKNLWAALAAIFSYIVISTPLNSCLCFILMPLQSVAFPVIIFIETFSRICGLGFGLEGQLNAGFIEMGYVGKHLLFLIMHLVLALIIYKLLVKRFQFSFVERV